MKIFWSLSTINFILVFEKKRLSLMTFWIKSPQYYKLSVKCCLHVRKTCDDEIAWHRPIICSLWHVSNDSLNSHRILYYWKNDSLVMLASIVFIYKRYFAATPRQLFLFGRHLFEMPIRNGSLWGFLWLVWSDFYSRTNLSHKRLNINSLFWKTLFVDNTLSFHHTRSLFTWIVK